MTGLIGGMGETEQCFYGQSIDVHAEPRDRSDTSGGDHGGVAKVLAGGHVAQMDLYDWCADGSDGVKQSDTGVGVGCRIEDDAIVTGCCVLKTVYQCALMVALKVFYFYLWKPLSERCKAVFHRLLPIEVGFACAQEVEVGAVDDDDSHDSFVE